jgi:alcohol dehydrogenase class IV
MNSTYFLPTKIVTGRNCVLEQCGLLKELGTRALIVTGKCSAKANGSYNDLVRALAANGQSHVLYDRVMSNPTIECVFEAGDLARRERCDFVVAIGGGSPMDTGKLAAGLAAQDVRRSDLFSTAFVKALPVAAIPTTAGTGSEVTATAVVTNPAAESKTSVVSPLFFPRCAFLDAAYTEGLSREVTINTAVDALTHAVEGMLSVKASALSNALARESVGAIMACLPDLEAPGVIPPATREKLLVAATLGGMVIANTGTTAVHPMGYKLTYFKNIDHGRANGILLGHYLKVLEKKDLALKTNRVKEVVAALKVGSLDDFTGMLERLFGRPEPIALSDLEGYAAAAIKAKNIGNCLIKPEQEDLLEIYTRAASQPPQPPAVS